MIFFIWVLAETKSRASMSPYKSSKGSIAASESGSRRASSSVSQVYKVIFLSNKCVPVPKVPYARPMTVNRQIKFGLSLLRYKMQANTLFDNQDR